MKIFGRAVRDSMIASEKNFIVAVVPLVSGSQSVTVTTLTPLNGRHIWDPSLWNLERISAIEVELEWESGGAGEVDLYDETNGVQLQQLVVTELAQALRVDKYDVTAVIKGLSAPTTLVIRAAGDGTNPLTVHSAKLLIRVMLG